MSKSMQFMKFFEKKIKTTIRTFMPAQIVSFNADEETADVQPLFLETLEDDEKPYKMPMLEDVPVLSFRLYEDGAGASNDKVYKQKYNKGDVVFIAICDRDIDDLQKKPFQPDSTNMFSIKDAVIIGGWNL